ncbi:hypothetical protein AVEN_198808-1 [Araneus ventricosus]|uniref:Uncharacterized protein n=1 Tax=Araneus ventricosus TaxID=182803 RepID=A0A4Y2KH76_ARAVE|nr:hypothetical protein AVEN_198808-1 [Araneus ventricosus]
MALLAKAQKVDLLSLVAEVGLNVSPNVGSLELIKSIQTSDNYDQETFKDLLKAVARIQKEKEEEREFADKEKEKEREKERT